MRATTRGRRGRRLVMVCLAALATASAGLAAEHAASNPMELSRAIGIARPGDTIVLADGVWRDARIDFTATGEAGRPIVLRARTPGKVRMVGRSQLHIGGEHLAVEGLLFTDGFAPGSVVEFRSRGKKPASQCRLTECAIVDYNPPDKKVNSKWVSLYGRRNRVDHCYLAGKTNLGTTLVVWLTEADNRHRIDHNLFGPRPPLGANGGETIRIGTSRRSMKNSRTTVEHNCFYRCNGEAEIISSKSCENVYRANTFLESGGALTLRHGNRCVVEGNFFLGNGRRHTGGVRVIGEGHRVVNNYFGELGGTGARSAVSIMNGIVDSPLHGYFQVKNAVIAFNTFVHCRSTLRIGLGAGPKRPLAPTDCVIANNILLGKTHALVTLTGEPTNLAWRGNLVHGAELGVPCPAGVTRTDPRLVRDAIALWRPAADSPAVGAAEGDFPNVTHDVDGQTRSPRKDVGCDQRSDAPVTRRPLPPADVGPSWMRDGPVNTP